MRERKIRNDFGLKDGVVRKYSGSSETAEIPYGAAMIAANAFRGLEQLTAVTIPDSMCGIGPFAFCGCKNLASIRLPDSVTTICEGAFRETAFFNNPENWTDDVLYIGHHLIRALPSVSGAYTIRAGTRTIAEGAFACCKKLTAVTVPDSVLTLGIRSFENCTALESVLLPDTLKRIGGMAFQGCTSLTQITLPLTLSTVGWNAFAFCEALTQVDLPAALTDVESKAFRHCINLKTVHYGGSQARREALYILDDNQALTDAEWIYKPEERSLVRKTIVFVCTGNTCRSPMAEEMMRKLLRDNGIEGVECTSCGLNVGSIRLLPSRNAVRAAMAYGADISEHRSRPINEELLRRGDLIVCMTRDHKQVLTEKYHVPEDKLVVLKIQDPCGGDEMRYAECAGDIHHALCKLLREHRFDADWRAAICAVLP